jgi:exodeoxyribonuclease-5
MKVVKDLTVEQKEALNASIEVITTQKKRAEYSIPFLKIGGFAGTGKTTLVSSIRETLNDVYKNKWNRVAFVTYTGKAATVLRKKLNGVFKEDIDYCGTIHSLIYKPIILFKDGKKILLGWQLKDEEELSYDAIIIDEASMLSEYIWQDLISYDIPIVAIGDHGQLPPIEGSFNLMEKPDLFLTQIHRQAETSPIIKLSKYIRERGFMPKVLTPNVFRLSWPSDECQRMWNSLDFSDSMICLCGFNYIRVWINKYVRSKFGFGNVEPYPGERVICLKNNKTSKIMNGQIGTMTWYMPYRKNMGKVVVQFDDRDVPFEGVIFQGTFNQESYDNLFDSDIITKEMKSIVANDGFDDGINFFDFGYAISVHKSQGSEWKRVVLLEQRSQHWDDEYYRRWLYTGVTRASEKLFIISDFR